jgi:hypothetical protein
MPVHTVDCSSNLHALSHAFAASRSLEYAYAHKAPIARASSKSVATMPRILARPPLLEFGDDERLSVGLVVIATEFNGDLLLRLELREF